MIMFDYMWPIVPYLLLNWLKNLNFYLHLNGFFIINTKIIYELCHGNICLIYLFI